VTNGWSIARCICLVTALASTLISCSPAGRPQHPHWLRIADAAGDLPTLNPHLTMGATMDFVAHLSMGYLIRYDRNARPIPDLATEIPNLQNGGVSADGLRVTWHLRHGVRWSDGAPFDARDVIFSIRTLLNPANNEVQGSTGWDLLAKLEMPDRYTVVYHLRRPYGAIVPLSFATVGGEPCLLPQHLLSRLPDINHAAYNSLPVGLGPFRIVSWKRGDRVEMEANPYFWRGRPKLDRITFSFLSSRDTLLVQLRSGDVDLWPLVPSTYIPQLATIKGITLTNSPTLRTTHLDFLMTPGAIADLAVRRAVRDAINRPGIVHTVEHDEAYVTNNIVWPGNSVLGNDPRIGGADPERARRELLADGWIPGPDGIRVKAGRRLSLNVPYQAGAGDLDEIMELLRAQLRAVGIEVVSRTYAHSVLFATAANGGIIDNAKFDMVMYSSTLTTVPDFASNFDCAQVPPHGENYTHWCDPRLAAPLAAMRAAYDEPTIERSYAAINRLFIDEVESIQLFVWRGGYAMSDRLRDYHPNLVSSFDDMLNVDI
jgi:peptide/nickel transport system substrate-binding protein